jgi:hypothetical protein
MGAQRPRDIIISDIDLNGMSLNGAQTGIVFSAGLGVPSVRFTGLKKNNNQIDSRGHSGPAKNTSDFDREIPGQRKRTGCRQPPDTVSSTVAVDAC